MRKRLLTLLAVACLTMHAWADLPFRLYRYEGFKAHDITPESIVFFGNSITNMHEWWEAFGNPLVINRGVSGAVSDELLAHLTPIIKGQPAKALLMIGTNDLSRPGTVAHVAQNVRQAVQRFRKESPRTEVYVQSILPSRRRNLSEQRAANDSLQAICREMGVKYVDLWHDLLSVAEDNQHTLDGLHLSASGYRIWCQKIAPLVGTPSTYPRAFADYASGLPTSNGMRASQFPVLPVHDGDVLMIGDEMVHSGEWHELLRSDRVRSRSIGWGFPGIDIEGMRQCLPAIFAGRPDHGTPSKAFIYLGAADMQQDSASVEKMVNCYEALLDEAHRLSPATRLVVGTVLPCGDEEKDRTLTVPFNQALARLCKQRPYAQVADIYATLTTNGQANPKYMSGPYVSGQGYLRLAELLRPMLVSK